jgi:AcrR family transcriptional regulator
VSQPAPARLPAAQRRSLIVAAALEVFGSGSYAGSTTAEIARAAGVSEPIIYRHFPSKRDLWFACVDEAWSRLSEAIEAKAASMSAGPSDVEAPETSPWASSVLPHLWLQGVTEAVEDDEIQRFLRGHVRDVHRYLTRRLRTLQDAGVIPPDRDPEAEAWIFLAGGLLRSFADRLGGLLRPSELSAVARERRRWLSGAS